MLFDSHAHLNFEEFNDTWRDVAGDCLANQIGVVNVGAQMATSQRAIAIAKAFDQGIYAAVGLHPIHVQGSDFHPEDFEDKKYADLIQSSPKVVAIGETGIDFFHSKINLAKQREVFVQQINLAKEYDKALIIHSRNSQDGKLLAYPEILGIVKKEKVKRAVVHCFGGTVKDAEAFLALGFYIGFTGIVTFKNATVIQEIAKTMPLERLLVETDAPYLAPEPYRGDRNKPQYVRYVAEKVAELRGISYNEVVTQTSKNTINLFGL